MLKNYFKIAARHLVKHKMFSIINILCLAIGITFTMLIGEYILHEKQVNAGIRNVDQQYLIKSNWKVKEMGLDVTTLGPLPLTLYKEHPSLVANYYRYNPVTNVVSAGDKHFKENIAIGDTTVVSMYGLEVLYGNPSKAFANNSSAVITESQALKLFDRKDAVGKTLEIQGVNNEKQAYTVSAVLKDRPFNSVIDLLDNDYKIFVPTVGNRYYPSGDPADNWAQVFEVGAVELQKGVEPKDLQTPVKQVLAKYASADINKNLTVELSPVKDYYIKSNNGAVQKMILTLSIVVIFIITMAVINFININIGTSSYRVKEIGLRKVFGGERRQLIIQHLTESLLLTFMSGLLSLALYELLRPYFSSIFNTPLSAVWQFDAARIILIALLIITIGIVAGMYPAFILSESNTITAIKGRIDTAKGGLNLRRSLLVVQFTLAIVVFVAALNVSNQVAYVFNRDPGYNKEHLLIATAFPKQWDSAGVAKMETIRNSLINLRGVTDASIAYEVPDRKPPNTISIIPVGSSVNQSYIVAVISADEHYAKTFGLKMASGSFLNADKNAYTPGQMVLNESAAKALGINVENAQEQQVKVPSFNNAIYAVSGIVKDFNYSSMHDKIEPLAFVHTRDAQSYRYLTIKLNTQNLSRTIDAIKEKWSALSPGAPFEYTFMDDSFQKLYQSELQLKKATQTATILNLLIVFMGIFGVVAFTLVKRNKEIAVRKVLGASVKNIMVLFIKDYAWLILIANIIAWPLAYYATEYWLQNFAYRMPQHINTYVFVMLFVFISTVAFIIAQCLRVAAGNPVKSLRTE